MLFTIFTVKNRNPTRLGITLIEVMMSTMVVSLGILGLVALIPLGTHLTERGVRADRIASLGPRAFHEARARGFFDPDNWIDATGSGAAASTGGSISLPLRQPYMIDPMFFGANGTHVSRRFFPYPATLAVGQTQPVSETYASSPNKPIRMHRLSIARNPGAASPTALSLPQAKSAFQSDDDLAFERPEDGELPPFQRFFQRGTTPSPVKRQAMGEYTWMVMLTPEPFALSSVDQITAGLNNAHGSYMQPPISTTNTYSNSDKAEVDATLASAATDEYTAHVIIARNRQANMPTDDISVIDTDEKKTNERVLDVTDFFASGGYSTGEVEISVTGGTLEEAEDLYLKVSNGDWICLVRRIPTASGLPNSFPRGDIYQWYKVVMVDEIIPASTTGPFTRRLTINGPDWPASSYLPTHAILVDSVVGVYSKRVRLETQSPWSP